MIHSIRCDSFLTQLSVTLGSLFQFEDGKESERRFKSLSPLLVFRFHVLMYKLVIKADNRIVIRRGGELAFLSPPPPLLSLSSSSRNLSLFITLLSIHPRSVHSSHPSIHLSTLRWFIFHPLIIPAWCGLRTHFSSSAWFLILMKKNFCGVFFGWRGRRDLPSRRYDSCSPWQLEMTFHQGEMHSHVMG